MKLKLVGPLASEAELPTLTAEDAGKTWWIGPVWMIWTGSAWQKALASLGNHD